MPAGDWRGKGAEVSDLQYHVYLRGELGKMRNRGDALSLLSVANHATLNRCGLPRDADGLSLLLPDQRSVRRFVRSIDSTDACILTRVLSEWRGNGVADAFVQAVRWCVTTVPIASVDVNGTEAGLRAIFEAHEGNLLALAADRALLATEPYSLRKPTARVEFPIVLGYRDGDRWRVFDGIHRAIQLARNEARRLRICVPDERTG